MDLNHDQQSCAKICCVLALRAHLDLTPCAMRHLHATRLLRSHAASTPGSLSVRTETCSCEKIVAISRRPQYRMISNSKARSSFYSNHARTRPLLSREPVARNFGCAKRHVPVKRLLRSRAAPNLDDFQFKGQIQFLQ